MTNSTQPLGDKATQLSVQQSRFAALAAQASADAARNAELEGLLREGLKAVQMLLTCSLIGEMAGMALVQESRDIAERIRKALEAKP